MNETLLATEQNRAKVFFDFSVKKQSIIKVVLWATFVMFLLSTPTQWLASWFDIPALDSVAEWMYRTFSFDSGKTFTHPWLLVTHMFMHGGIIHYGMNMLVLMMFYQSAKEFFPGKSWLIIYFAAGISGALLFAAFNEPGKLMVGASGGIMGLWGAAIAARIRYAFVDKDERPWQCQMTLDLLLKYLVIQVLFEMLVPNVAHSAHAGGMLAGLVVGALLPLMQQPRLVASRSGIFQPSKVEAKDKAGEYLIASIELTATEQFDPASDFIAVEYDEVDFLMRRSVCYEQLAGTLPAAVKESDVVHVVSSRQLFDETPLSYLRRKLDEAGQDGNSLAPKKKAPESYTFTIALLSYLFLSQLEITDIVVIALAFAGVVTLNLLWWHEGLIAFKEFKPRLRAYLPKAIALIAFTNALVFMGYKNDAAILVASYALASSGQLMIDRLRRGRSVPQTDEQTAS